MSSNRKCAECQYIIHVEEGQKPTIYWGYWFHELCFDRWATKRLHRLEMAARCRPLSPEERMLLDDLRGLHPEASMGKVKRKFARDKNSGRFVHPEIEKELV